MLRLLTVLTFLALDFFLSHCSRKSVLQGGKLDLPTLTPADVALHTRTSADVNLHTLSSGDLNLHTRHLQI